MQSLVSHGVAACFGAATLSIILLMCSSQSAPTPAPATRPTPVVVKNTADLLAPDGEGISRLNVKFPSGSPLQGTPTVVATVCDLQGDQKHPDTFAVCIANVTTESFDVRVSRLDQKTWSTKLRLHYIAAW